MHRAHERRWVGAIVLLAGFLPPRPGVAAEPHVVLQVGSIDGILGDVRQMLSLVGPVAAGFDPDRAIGQATQGKGLAGVNRGKPLGAALSFEKDGSPSVVVFVPVDDVKAFLDLLRGFFPNQVQAPDGLVSLEGLLGSVHCKFTGGYGFFAWSAAQLAQASVPRISWGSRHAVVLEANMGRLPKELVESLRRQLNGFLAGAERGKPPPSTPAEARGREMGREVIKTYLERMLTETERVGFGASLSHSGQLDVEGEILAQPSTSLAADLVSLGRSNPSFGALWNPNAAVSIVCSAPLSNRMRDEWLFTLRSMNEAAEADIERSGRYLSVADEHAARGLMERVFKLLRDVERLDFGFTLDVAADGKPIVLAGARVTNGLEINKLLEEVLRVSARKPDGTLKLDTATHGGLRIHTLPDFFRELGCGSGPAHFAVGNDRVLFAAGGEALALLKMVIDRTGSSGPRAPPVAMRMRLSKYCDLLARSEPAAAAAREALRGKEDSITYELIPSDRGARGKVSIGPGIFRLIGLVGGKGSPARPAPRGNPRH